MINSNERIIKHKIVPAESTRETWKRLTGLQAYKMLELSRDTAVSY